MANDADNISFKIKQDKDCTVCGIEIYRTYKDKNGNKCKVYIDTTHPMSMIELWKLKIFLQEYLYNADWDG
jgi:hypothetical protein